jgi:hypothetical protein
MSGKWRVVIALFCLLYGVAEAAAGEAAAVAERAGFLLGHAHRCGVGAHRLARSAQLVTALIGAFAADEDDERAARDRFASRLLAGALAEPLAGRLASCPAVRTQLAILERHRPPGTDRAGPPEAGRQAQRTRAPVMSAWKAARSSGPK